MIVLTCVQKASVSLLVAFSSLLVTPSFADEGPVETSDGSKSPAVLETIVVTAQKRSENLEKVPIAVTALTANELQGGNIEGQLDLPRLTPNLNFSVVASYAAAYIRGVGTYYANAGLESSVPVYLDDAYLPRAESGIFDFNDLARIEVLKGPQGTLYGRNASGGAIRLITNDPKFGVVEGSSNVTYGSEDRIKYGGVLNLPLGDKIALRFSIERDQDSGYLTDINPARYGKVGDRNEAQYMAKLLWEFNDQLQMKVSWHYETKNDNEGMTFQNVFTGPPQIGLVVGGCGSNSFYNICADNPGFGDHVKASGLTGRVDYHFESAMLSSITSYQTEKEEAFADIDATGAPFEDTHGSPNTRQITQEFQVTSEFSGPLKYVAGLYFLHERAQYDYSAYGESIDAGFGATGTALGLGDANLDYTAQGAGVKTNSIAPYVQADYSLTNKATLTLGARYTSEKKTLLSNVSGLGLINPNGYLVPGSLISPLTGECTEEGQVLCSQSNTEVKFNKFTPKVTLSYQLDAPDLVYLTYSQGFKSGGFSLPNYNTIDKINPETLDDIEGGWKYDSGRVRFNGAAFFYNYKNLQVQVTDPATSATFTKNGANAHIYGVEGDLNWLVVGNFEIAAGGGYLHSRYTSFPDGEIYVLNNTTNACAVSPAACLGISFPAKDVSGLELENAPSVTAYLQPQYTQSIGAYGKIMYSSVANFRSKAYFDIGNQVADGQRTLLSARIQWVSDNERYSVAVFGENLTARQYYLSRTIEGVGGFQVPAPPRQGYITANVRF